MSLRSRPASVYDRISQLVCVRILYPYSKSKTVSCVFPHLYGSRLRQLLFWNRAFWREQTERGFSIGQTEIINDGQPKMIPRNSFSGGALWLVRRPCVMWTPHCLKPMCFLLQPFSWIWCALLRNGRFHSDAPYFRQRCRKSFGVRNGENQKKRENNSMQTLSPVAGCRLDNPMPVILVDIPKKLF